MLLAVGTVATACDRADEPVGWPAATTGTSTVRLTAEQRRVADQIVSVFEYSDPRPRYDSVLELADGRGLTCGTIGFTTSSTEVRDIVAGYLARVPDAPLGRHLPRLRELAETGSADTSGLAGFAEDWASAASDPGFRAEQDALTDRLAFEPALAAAHRLNIRTALGVAILYDTAVQHGTGDDPDGLPALIGRADQRAGGAPSAGVPERTWLRAYLDVREDDLRSPHDESTREVWAESVDRVDALRGLVAEGHPDLTPPVTVEVAGDGYELS